MSRSKGLANKLQNLLPSPFTIAIVLTIMAMVLAMLNSSKEASFSEYFPKLVGDWSTGLWQSNQLVFAFQMMLMLVLGHVLALSNPIEKFIALITKHFCTSTAKAAAIVTLLTMLMAFFNWGLGLVFGAVFARKVAEFSEQEGRPINFPLIAAAGYSGLMVWHGGLSGSALVKVAEEGHLSKMMG
ncbi:MAG: TIGR00366 family protein, partial [Flavobacteriales bacterium]